MVRDVTEESRVFTESKRPVRDLFDEARDVGRRFRVGSAVLGAFLGLVLGGRLLAVSIRKGGTDFRPHRGDCFSCGRCVSYCSVARKPEALKGEGAAK